MNLPPLNHASLRPIPPGRPAQLDAWFASEAGKAMLAAQRAMLAPWLPYQVGHRAVEISAVRGQQLLRGCRLPWRTSLGTRGAPGHRVYTDLQHLPLAKGSVDLLLLHHCLEFSGQPHDVLREAARSVAPGGKLAIVGFHPLSTLGLLRWFCLGRRPCWSGHFYSPQRLTDWLQVLGFELDGMSSGFYHVPFSASARRRLSLVAWLGARLWPRHGASYLLVARKRAGQATLLPQRRGLRGPATVVPLPLANYHKQRDDRADP